MQSRGHIKNSVVMSNVNGFSIKLPLIEKKHVMQISLTNAERSWIGG